MKLILAFFLCGVAYATALPTCSPKELDQCGHPSGDDAYQETEEFLNEVCRSVGCITNYKRRCDTSGLQTYMKGMLNQSEKIYNATCGHKNKPMRQKYLVNAKCIIRVTKNFMSSCKPPSVFDIKDPNYCPNVEEYIACTANMMGMECGSDAREVYETFAADLEFYGCK